MLIVSVERTQSYNNKHRQISFSAIKDFAHFLCLTFYYFFYDPAFYAHETLPSKAPLIQKLLNQRCILFAVPASSAKNLIFQFIDIFPDRLMFFFGDRQLPRHVL